MSLSVTVLIGGALHAQSGQGLSGGQLLEDQACTIALPAHNRVCLVEVAGVLQASAHRRDMLVELREFDVSLVGHAERIRGEGKSLAPVAARLRGEEDGSYLAEGRQSLGVVVLHGRAVNEDQVRVGGTNGLQVGGADGPQNRDVSGAIKEVVGDRLLAAARYDTNGRYSQGERVVGGRFGKRHDAGRMRGHSDLLAGGIGNDAGLDGPVRSRGRGRGGLRGGACSQGQGCKSESRESANSCRDIHVFLNSIRSR